MSTEEANQNGMSVNKKKTRPAQRLYVPPAQRNKKHSAKNSQETQECLSQTPVEQLTNVTTKVQNVPSTTESSNDEVEVQNPNLEDTKEVEVSQKRENESIEKRVEHLKIKETETDIDGEKEEMQRAIVNINRKTRPLIKHVSVVKNDILHIDVVEKKTNSKSNNPLTEVSTWEDLLNEDDELIEDYVNKHDGADFNASLIQIDNKDDDDDEGDPLNQRKNKSLEDLEHVIEIFDFPSTFKSHDIMQLYHEFQKEATMYIKWCDDTHALLVFSSPTLAQRALHLKNDIIKSRPMSQSGSLAFQTAMKSDLKPAMKRPPTTMQTARRLITTHLGTRTKISKEEQEKEKEMLRKAKELKKSQRQHEKDAWEGFSRPSTA